MKYWAIITALLTLTPAIGTAASAADQLDCKTGPIARNFGGGSWLAYACNDAHSLVLVSAPGNKATPFYFMLHWENGRHQISGEGIGDKTASDAALRDIRALSESDISKLFAQAHRSQAPR